MALAEVVYLAGEFYVSDNPCRRKESQYNRFSKQPQKYRSYFTSFVMVDLP
jgi:hypothetical protein